MNTDVTHSNMSSPQNESPQTPSVRDRFNSLYLRRSLLWLSGVAVLQGVAELTFWDHSAFGMPALTVFTAVLLMLLSLLPLGTKKDVRGPALLILIGAPVLSLRILLTSGFGSAQTIWFAILVSYGQLLLSKRLFRWSAIYVTLIGLSTLFMEYSLGERLSAHVNSYPPWLDYQISLLTLLTLFFHLYTYESLRRTNTENIYQYEEKIFEMTKMAQMGEMAAIIAHQINTPLNVISLTAEIARERLNGAELPKEEARALFERTYRVARKIKEITDSLLEYSKRRPQDPLAPVDPLHLVTEVLSICRPRIEVTGLKVNWDNLLPQGVKALCRPADVEQILMSFINNAIEATESQPEPWIKIQLMQNEQQIIFRIVDTGPGVKPEYRDKLFELYFSTKSSGGTGLGLNVAQRLAFKQGGEVRMVDEAKETTFELTLKKAA